MTLSSNRNDTDSRSMRWVSGVPVVLGSASMHSIDPRIKINRARRVLAGLSRFKVLIPLIVPATFISI